MVMPSCNGVVHQGGKNDLCGGKNDLCGAWRPVGRRQYALTAVRLHLDQQGLLLGTMKTRSMLTLDTPNHWYGMFTFDVLDPSGSERVNELTTCRCGRIPLLVRRGGRDI